MRAKGASEEEIELAQKEAAEFLRDNLLKLGPSFVKVGLHPRVTALRLRASTNALYCSANFAARSSALYSY